METIGVRYIGGNSSSKKATYVVTAVNYTSSTSKLFTIPTDWTAITFTDLANCKFWIFDSYIYWLRVVNSVTTELFYRTNKTATNFT